MPAVDQVDVSQETILSFLEDPASYPHSPDHVEVLQTHISYVALASPYVYKVKKDVDLGFADFSTAEKRRHYSEEEVRLNSRLCPGIYEGVVPLYYREGRLTFGGDGEAVTYAVKMKELSGGEFLHDRLGRGALQHEDLERVANRLATFYEDRSPPPEVAVWGRTARLRLSTDENFEQTRPYVDRALLRPAYDAIQYFTDRFYDQHTTLLNRRRAEGSIVDGHGDLRLEHVYLTPEKVCIYDCIEFSDRLRYVDVANDVGFMAMDLDYQGRPDLSRFFIEELAARRGDASLMRLVDFYKCYRAYVRGKVECMRSDEEEVPAGERAASLERAQRYFQLAAQYATAGSGPAVLVVMGRIGTGKSTQARLLGEVLGWEVVSSDRIRKETAGASLDERGGDELYTAERTRQTYEALQEKALTRSAGGRGTILDATYGKREHREALRRILQQENVPYCFIELQASDERVRDRLRSRQAGDGRQLSDARLENFEELTRSYEAPDDREETYHFTAETENNPEETARDILKHVTRFDLNN